MCSVLFPVPFVSCLTLPLAVVGGTMLFAKYEAIPSASVIIQRAADHFLSEVATKSFACMMRARLF
jgi:hypothetical protein